MGDLAAPFRTNVPATARTAGAVRLTYRSIERLAA
jgi:hypothetical protein